jgi:transcriptional regulator with XRE-family HTH domain
MNNNLAKWINKKLEETGWSIRELARRVDVSPSHISRIANSEINPSPELAKRMALAFSVSPEEVFKLIGWLPEQSFVDPAEEEILELFRLLDTERKSHLILIAKDLTEIRPRRKKLNTEERQEEIPKSG